MEGFGAETTLGAMRLVGRRGCCHAEFERRVELPNTSKQAVEGGFCGSGVASMASSKMSRRQPQVLTLPFGCGDDFVTIATPLSCCRAIRQGAEAAPKQEIVWRISDKQEKIPYVSKAAKIVTVVCLTRDQVN